MAGLSSEGGSKDAFLLVRFDVTNNIPIGQERVNVWAWREENRTCEMQFEMRKT